MAETTEGGELAPGVYNNTEMAEVESSMIELCRQLSEGLLQGKYGLIIGDDTSGRVPALVIKGFANYLASRNKRPNVPLVFVDMSPKRDREESLNELNRRITAHKLEGNQRALLVTEYMNSGWTIVTAGKVLDDKKVPYDIAAIGVGRWAHEYLPDPARVHLFLATLEEPSIYGKPHISGFARNEGEIRPFGRDSVEKQKMVNKTRADVSLMIQRIASRLYPQPAEQAA